VGTKPSQVFRRNLQTGGTVLVSESRRGQPGRSASGRPAINGSGRYVAFESKANNLVRDDTNSHTDVFRFDARGRTKLVSVDRNGRPANDWSRFPDISRNGENVVFASRARDLVSERVGRHPQVYERYLRGSTVLGSEPFGAHPPNGGSGAPAISGTGFSWAFESSATNLVRRPDSRFRDVFLFSYV
jgi:Tol biopolymer transport system component